MKLELAEFPVKDVRFSKQTSYNKGILAINREELTTLILEDKRITGAELDVAFPNEKTRIVLIRDAVEPRIKVSGPGCVFPGILGPVETIGEGRTHRLSGVTVMPIAQYSPSKEGVVAQQRPGLLDMWGSGSLLTPLASTINIVLILKLIDNTTELEAHAAIQLAEFKVANRLAEATRHLTPQDVEVFELFEVDDSLPRVVYILSAVMISDIPHSGIALYGLPIRESLPTFIHPNTLLDGVLTVNACQGGGNRPTTWGWLNHPMVLRLLKEHGKRLNFMGVILQRTEFVTDLGKQVSAECASQMASLVGANGAIITKVGRSGNAFVEVMLTVQACEKKGVKTVLLTSEWGGSDGTESPLVLYVPEATAIVSVGGHEHEIKLPAPSRVIGVREGQLVEMEQGDLLSPWDELTLAGCYDIANGIDFWGGMNVTSKEY